jgi:hypothetical protein
MYQFGDVPKLTPFFQWCQLDGKVVWFLTDEKFAVQVGKGKKGSYKTKYVMQGFYRAYNMYYGVNLGPGYKKRIFRLSNEKVVLKTAFSGLP